MQAGGKRSFGSLTVLALVVVLLPTVSRAETVYRYTSSTFNNVAGVYTTSDRLTGEFTTASPLPVNLSFQDISGLVTSFSFADGHQTMSEADLGSFDVIDFRISTDASGAIADWTITLVLGVRVIQAISNAGSHNDSGSLDLSDYGGIAGVRGSWQIRAPAIPALGPPWLWALAVLLMTASGLALGSRARRS